MTFIAIHGCVIPEKKYHYVSRIRFSENEEIVVIEHRDMGGKVRAIEEVMESYINYTECETPPEGIRILLKVKKQMSI